MLPYIDLHTHQIYSDQVWYIYNSFLEYQPSLDRQSMGLHPYHIEDFFTQGDLLSLNQEISAVKGQILAIGECGLDKRIANFTSLQVEVFQAHIHLANQLKKPLIIHCVQAYQEVVEQLKLAQVPVIFHGFNKNYELAKQLLKSGYYVSVGQDVIRNPEKYQSLITREHLDHLFFETDDAPLHIGEVYQKASDVSGISLNALLDMTHQNYHSVFDKIV